MRHAIYNGPDDALQIGEKILPRGEKVEISEDEARRFGERGSWAEYDVTISDDQKEKGSAPTPPKAGETT